MSPTQNPRSMIDPGDLARLVSDFERGFGEYYCEEIADEERALRLQHEREERERLARLAAWRDRYVMILLKDHVSRLIEESDDGPDRRLKAQDGDGDERGLEAEEGRGRNCEKETASEDGEGETDEEEKARLSRDGAAVLLPHTTTRDRVEAEEMVIRVCHAAQATEYCVLRCTYCTPPFRPGSQGPDEVRSSWLEHGKDCHGDQRMETFRDVTEAFGWKVVDAGPEWYEERPQHLTIAGGGEPATKNHPRQRSENDKPDMTGRLKVEPDPATSAQRGTTRWSRPEDRDMPRRRECWELEASTREDPRYMDRSDEKPGQDSAHPLLESSPASLPSPDTIEQGQLPPDETTAPASPEIPQTATSSPTTTASTAAAGGAKRPSTSSPPVLPRKKSKTKRTGGIRTQVGAHSRGIRSAAGGPVETGSPSFGSSEWNAEARSTRSSAIVSKRAAGPGGLARPERDSVNTISLPAPLARPQASSFVVSGEGGGWIPGGTSRRFCVPSQTARGSAHPPRRFHDHLRRARREFTARKASHHVHRDLGTSTKATTAEDPLAFVPQPEPAARGDPEAGVMAPPKSSPRFTQSQLAMALTVAKSKPAGLPTADYIQQLRKHVRAGRPGPREQLRYVDTAEFWKDQYDKMRQEKGGLEDKVRCLEEANRQLRDKLRSGQTLGGSGHSELAHHHTHERGQPRMRSEAGMSRKRAAHSQEVDSPDDQEPSFLASLEVDDHLRLSGYALQVMRQRGRLQSSAQECSTLDQINHLTRQILLTITLLEEPLTSCCLPLRSLRANGGDPRTLFLLQQVFQQVALSFLACFSAMDELFLTIPGRSKKREVVYRVVMLFRRSLDFLHIISGLQSEDERPDRSQHTRGKRPRVEAAEYAVNRYLAQTLASTVKNLEWKHNQAGHSEILEGLLFSLLQHTGRLISNSVFGEHVAASDNPGNISESLDAREDGVLSPESRYVVQVLHAVLGGSDRKQFVADMLASGRSSSRGVGLVPAASGEVLGKARKLLQSTLWKSTVGGAELESLRLPRPPSESSDLQQDKAGVEKYGKEWLLETVWGLVGWDLVT
ncbi:hypothetical protein JHW43_004668 [Diplocarpon mali]|nr:hypothetical protein JHW43_004668 [Diplocarpon mali]